MAHLTPNLPTQHPHLSELLPTVKCSSCSHPVPLEGLVDHICALTSSNLAGDTNPAPPPLKVQTALPPPNRAHPTPMDTRFTRRPSANSQDKHVHNGARLRKKPSRTSSRGATNRAPSRDGVRSPAPLSPVAPPSRRQSPFVSPSTARQPVPRSDVPPNVIPAITQPGNLRTRPPALTSPTAPLDTRSPFQRRPSVPPSPLAQTAPHVHDARDPHPAPMPAHPNHHHRPAVQTTPSPAPSDYSPQRFESPEFDTKSGGAAGMAGVGRRGFAAVARAAMFASHLQTSTTVLPAPWVPTSSSPQVMDVGRIKSPPLGSLDSRAAPPMPYSRSPSPSPGSLPSPSQDSSNIPPFPPPAPSPTPPPHGRESNSTPKPSSIPFPVKPASPPKPSNASGPSTPTSPTGPSFSSDKSSQKKVSAPRDTIQVVNQADTKSSFLDRAAGDEESELGRLAYAQSDESDDDELIARGMGRRMHHSPSVSSTYSDDHLHTEQTSLEHGLDIALAALLKSPTSTETPLSPSPPTTPISRAPKPPMRSLTSHPQRDSSTLGGIINRRAGTISGAIGGGSADKSRKDRLSQESSASGLDIHRGKSLTCIRCSKDVEDKRWIRVENGRGVLCDKCWKNMYLPKCRRCNLPIEKQAVSSSDGQLKGKYHRDCFNCHTCHKPFPDKTFYVFDGKPFCDYHYHEANHSLCAAPDCGRPIEGPCAVSHTGARYHIEHLTCEYEDDKNGKRCDERLVDYWEIEGRMLCERHMRRVVEQDMMGVGLEEIGTSSDSRAMKRRTRFIDIAGLR
ncbi:hypothetical protein BJV74DRAFT_970003 [Russula compacta]|nr:hypothetical protein BJV74DRAFT_970003 [Russula compacta]